MTGVVDLHTHIYPPSYISLLKTRKEVPYIHTPPESPDTHRLIILPTDDDASLPPASRGRPVGPDYWDIKEKLSFMDTHNISTSVISLANPWLDFLDPDLATEWATTVNEEINDICEEYPGRLYGFAVLPLSAPADAVVTEIKKLKALKRMRGVIMGTTGLGKGLDDPALDPVWAALQEEEQMVFLHPHYGLPAEVFGPRAAEYGHVLPLALGFPLETTIAVSRMYMSGAFEKFKRLYILLAHSGGTLPFLAGRIESCVLHDGYLKKQGKLEGRRSIWDVLTSNIYLDAVVYGEAGLKAAIQASGADRLMFGTDHPFFPPLGDEKEWLSVRTNYDAIHSAFTGDAKTAADVLGGNARRILRLYK